MLKTKENETLVDKGKKLEVMRKEVAKMKLWRQKFKNQKLCGKKNKRS